MLKEANKVLRKLQSRKVSLKIAYMGDFKRVEILFCTDATDASLKFDSFQGAYLVAYVVPVVSQSEKISRVTKSSIALETLTLNKGADAVYFLARQEIPLLALHKKMNFSIKDLVTFTEEILNGKLHFRAVRMTLHKPNV